MWPFSRKRVSVRELLHGSTDFHSHILPGVDDGVRTIREALEILKRYEQWGVQAVWLTPHVMEDMPNTTERLKERFSELQQAYSGNIRLHLAAEYMLDRLFEERLESGDLLPLGEQGTHLLVETSCFNPPYNLHQMLQRIQSKGLYPVLAHPERYMYMDRDEYRQLKDMGVKFQLHLPSLAGMYGKQVQKKAEWLKKNSMYEFIGTDTHGIHMIDNIK